MQLVDFRMSQGKRIAKTVPSSDRICRDDGENTAPRTDLGGTIKVRNETIIHGPELRCPCKYPSGTVKVRLFSRHRPWIWPSFTDVHSVFEPLRGQSMYCLSTRPIGSRFANNTISVRIINL